MFFNGSTFLFNKFADYIRNTEHIIKISGKLHIYRNIAHLNISGQPYGKACMRLALVKLRVSENEMFPPAGTDHPAIQLKFFHNIHQYFRLFRIVNVYEHSIFCKDPGIFRE